MTRISLVIIVIAMLLTALGWAEAQYQKSKKKPSLYQLYHTAEAISDKWYDATAVGLCDHCGMDDSPIVATWAGKAKCKWCAEFDNITWHIKNKGRFETEAKLNPTSYPPKPPGGSGGGSPAPKSMDDQISEVVTQIGTDYKALNERLRKLEEENELLRAQTAHVRDVEVSEIHDGSGRVVRRILSERFEARAVYSDNLKYVNLMTPNERRDLEDIGMVFPEPTFNYPKR